MSYPLKLELVEKEYIWGREISCQPEEMSIVDNGEFAGFREFPFNIKFIEINELLPVQLNATNRNVNSQRHFESGFNKIWYVLAAKPGVRLALGLVQDTNKEKLAKRIGDGTILDCLNYIDIFSGDIIGIPSGLVHAGGKGISLVEIQVAANMLYTFYDYNRVDIKGQKTPLSIIKALDATDCRRQGEKYNGLEILLNEQARKLVLAASQFFALELYIIDDEAEEETDSSSFVTHTFIEGEAIIEYGTDFLIARQGDIVMIPAALGAYRLKGKFKSLKAYVPKPEADIITPLKKAGYTGEEIKKNIGWIGGV